MVFGFKPGSPKYSVLFLPMIGMGLFILFYIAAALVYPGGSWNDTQASGFSFWNNYLCDLLDQYAINGQLNDARHFARISLGFLCGALLLLWYYLPSLFPKKSINRSIMWTSGILALGTTCFLSSGTHDVTVRIAGFFGVIAFISCFVELYKVQRYGLFYLGIWCLLIFVINYYIYETGNLIQGLPIIQKVTFVCCISWFMILNISMLKNVKTIEQGSEVL